MEAAPVEATTLKSLYEVSSRIQVGFDAITLGGKLLASIMLIDQSPFYVLFVLKTVCTYVNS